MHVLPTVTLLAALACLLPSGGTALECYACRNEKPIKDIVLQADITTKLAKFPKCTELMDKAPTDKFKQKCSMQMKSCATIVDPSDDKNQVRTCFPADKNECQKKACYCKKDLCNSAASGWTSAAVVALALTALLVGR